MLITNVPCHTLNHCSIGRSYVYIEFYVLTDFKSFEPTHARVHTEILIMLSSLQDQYLINVIIQYQVPIFINIVHSNLTVIKETNIYLYIHVVLFIYVQIIQLGHGKINLMFHGPHQITTSGKN